MQLRKLLSTDEEQAVSPVIGVILMVAITVILAAVIASFVLGLGDQQEVAPTAQFEFSFDSDTPQVTVTHVGGDNVVAADLYVRGNGPVSDAGSDWPTVCGGSDCTSATIGEDDAVASGDSINVGLDDSGSPSASEYVLRMVWQTEDGSSSQELAVDRGPDA